MRTACILAIIIAAFLMYAGCTSQTSTSPSPGVSSASPPATESPAGGSRIVIEDGTGKTLWSLEAGTGSYKIYDSTDQKIGELKVEADRVKIKDKDDKILWKIKKKENGCKLYDGNDKELYKIRRKEGGFRIKDPAGGEVAKIKPKEGYLEITGPAKIKIKSDGEKIKIKDDGGTTLFETKGTFKQDEACFLGLTNFEPLQRIGLVIFFHDVK